MTELAGVGKANRTKLAKLSRAFGETPFSITQAQNVLGSRGPEVSRLLATLATHGWVKRIRRGHYFLVPIESTDTSPIVEDPWFTANNLFYPCYISGWSAAEHWGFTEQIFRSIYVVTSRKVKNSNQSAGGADFVVKSVKSNRLFGTKPVWKGKSKVLVADPSKLIIDMLDSPDCVGGISHSIQIFRSYLKSEHSSPSKVLEYAAKQGNKTIFKRLGFLLENLLPNETSLIQECKAQLSAGYSKLDPSLKSDKIITRWRLWIPSFVEKDLKE